MSSKATILVDFQRLNPSSLDVAQMAADYAWPKTVAGAWKWLFTQLETDQISRETYNEIKDEVRFVQLAPEGMETYKMVLTHPEDILDPQWGFFAANQADADRKASGWNRHHGKANSPGYGHVTAVLVARSWFSETVSIQNEWVENY